MKKVLASILLILYVAVSAGSAVHLHYCDGKWMTDADMMVPVAGDGTHCITCEHGQKEKDCCKHPRIQVKISPDQLAPDIAVIKAFSTPNHFAFFYCNAFPGYTRTEKTILSLTFFHPPGRITRSNRRLAFIGTFLI